MTDNLLIHLLEKNKIKDVEAKGKAIFFYSFAVPHPVEIKRTKHKLLYLL